jgi:hypothetical protein
MFCIHFKIYVSFSITIQNTLVSGSRVSVVRARMAQRDCRTSSDPSARRWTHDTSQGTSAGFGSSAERQRGLVQSTSKNHQKELAEVEESFNTIKESNRKEGQATALSIEVQRLGNAMFLNHREGNAIKKQLFAVEEAAVRMQVDAAEHDESVAARCERTLVPLLHWTAKSNWRR